MKAKTVKIKLLFFIVVMGYFNISKGQRILSLATNGTGLFVGSFNKGLFMVSENGNVWTQLDKGIAATSNIYSLAVSGSTIIAGAERGTFISKDNGSSWTDINNGLENWNTFDALVIKGTDIFGKSSLGVYIKSINEGEWKKIKKGFPDFPDKNIAVSGTTMVKGTENEGVFLSTDNGTTWTPLNKGFSRKYKATSLAIIGTSIYVGTDDGIFVTSNNGDLWKEANTGFINLKEAKGKETVRMKAAEDSSKAAVVRIAQENYIKEAPAREAAKKLKEEKYKIAANYFHGLAEFSYKNFEPSLQYYNKAITSFPNFAEALSARGDWYFEMKQMDKAVKDYEAADKITKNINSYKLARAYALSGNKDGAFNHLELFLSASEDEKKYKKTKEEIKDAIDLNSLKGDERWKVLFSKKYSTPTDKAIKTAASDNETNVFYSAFYDLRKEVESNPTTRVEYYYKDDWAYNLLGEKEIRGGDSNKGIVNFTKAIELNNKVAIYYVNRGEAYMNLNKSDDAINDFRAADKIDPEVRKQHENSKPPTYHFCYDCSGKGEIEYQVEVYVTDENGNKYYKYGQSGALQTKFETRKKMCSKCNGEGKVVGKKKYKQYKEEKVKKQEPNGYTY